MSDFTNSVVDDITSVISTVADKVKEVGGYAKLQTLIKAEEAKKQESYYRLGRKYYELYKDAPASDLADIMAKIVAADEKIAAYKEELKAAAAAENVKAEADVTDADFAEDCEEAAQDVIEEITEEPSEETTEE